jgi:glycerol transport system permease protein
MNTVISVLALPAAYAFSRYRFLGDKHLFFWLLTNRMAPPAVFALPFFQLYSAIRPDRHAHRGGAGALPVQRAAGGVDPRRLHVRRAEGDRRDGLYRRLLVPALLREDLHAADGIRHRRRGLLLLHVLLGRAAARPHADDDNAKPIAAIMTRTVSRVSLGRAGGMDWGVLVRGRPA